MEVIDSKAGKIEKGVIEYGNQKAGKYWQIDFCDADDKRIRKKFKKKKDATKELSSNLKRREAK